MSMIFKLVKDKWVTPQKSQESFSGRNIIVTGATSGIGFVAAANYASSGASKVIITARDMAKGDKTLAELQEKVDSKDQFEVWELDMSSYDSVTAFANRAAGLDHLDVVVLNAGVRRDPFTFSEYGWEEDLQVNVLSTILLGILLLPKLKESNRGNTIPVLEFVNSGLHFTADVSSSVRNSPSILAEYNKPEQFSAQNQYVHSKLLLMFATNKLAEMTSSSEVIITSVCPGAVSSNLARDVKMPGISIALAIMRMTVLRTPEQAANSYVTGTAQDEGLHGRFWKSDTIQPIADSISGEENEKLGVRVWDEIVKALTKDVPVVKEVLATLIS